MGLVLVTDIARFRHHRNPPPLSLLTSERVGVHSALLKLLAFLIHTPSTWKSSPPSHSRDRGAFKSTSISWATSLFCCCAYVQFPTIRPLSVTEVGSWFTPRTVISLSFCSMVKSPSAEMTTSLEVERNFRIRLGPGGSEIPSSMYAVPNARPWEDWDTKSEYGPCLVSSMVYAGSAWSRIIDPSRTWTFIWLRGAANVTRSPGMFSRTSCVYQSRQTTVPLPGKNPIRYECG